MTDNEQVEKPERRAHKSKISVKQIVSIVAMVVAANQAVDKAVPAVTAGFSDGQPTTLTTSAVNPAGHDRILAEILNRLDVITARADAQKKEADNRALIQSAKIEKILTSVAGMRGYVFGRLGRSTSSAESPADTGLAYRAKRFKKRRGNG